MSFQAFARIHQHFHPSADSKTNIAVDAVFYPNVLFGIHNDCVITLENNLKMFNRAYAVNNGNEPKHYDLVMLIFSHPHTRIAAQILLDEQFRGLFNMSRCEWQYIVNYIKNPDYRTGISRNIICPIAAYPC
jgi:hypothetical protein